MSNSPKQKQTSQVTRQTKSNLVGNITELQNKIVELYVTDTDQSPFKASHDLGLVQVVMTLQSNLENHIKEFPEIFNLQ